MFSTKLRSTSVAVATDVLTSLELALTSTTSELEPIARITSLERRSWTWTSTSSVVSLNPAALTTILYRLGWRLGDDASFNVGGGDIRAHHGSSLRVPYQAGDASALALRQQQRRGPQANQR